MIKYLPQNWLKHIWLINSDSKSFAGGVIFALVLPEFFLIHLKIIILRLPFILIPQVLKLAIIFSEISMIPRAKLMATFII